MKYLCTLIVLIPAALLMAANPVGRVNSTGPLTLNGKAVPATAVSSLPVVAGDEIVTLDAPATIFFSDKSRATIEPNSRVKLESRSTSLAVRVLAGSADLKRAAGSHISLIAPGGRATPVGNGGVSRGTTPLVSDPKAPSRSHPCPDKNPHCN